MRRPARLLVGITLGIGLFSAGYLANRPDTPATSVGEAKQETTYACPMHPQFTLNHPGDCGICGMRLLPVSGGGQQGAPEGATPDSTGMVVVSASSQQMIGVRTDQVIRQSSSQVMRVPGRIAVDDQRLYRIIAAADGWITALGQNTVGRFVKKDQLLASYYTRELLSAERLFLLSASPTDPVPRDARDFSAASIRTAGAANPLFPVDTLRSLGMSDLQIEEIHKTRTPAPHVNIYAPVSGFVLSRNISPNQRFDKGTELYRIGDISRVWVLTDIFEKDREFLKPGAEASVLYQGRRLKARMSDSLPQFDAQSRTLQTRFELENPGYALQPDIFVDVEINVQMPEAMTVPADAVFDSGLRKTVFVDHGNGKFEARRVETGWRLGGRVQIIRGLMEGERVAAAANFLLDSESRMRAVAAGIFNPEIDPVCGMEVDGKKAEAAGRTASHDGHTYYFCADDCKKKFLADPAQYADHAHGKPSGTPAPPGGMPGMMKPGAVKTAAAEEPAKDLICGMDVDKQAAKAAGRTSEYQGKTYYFCSDDCKKQFDAEPGKYVK